MESKRKVYTYRGYEFNASDVTADVIIRNGLRSHTEIRNTYEIRNAQTGAIEHSPMVRPFLASVKQVKAEIDAWIEEEELRKTHKHGDYLGKDKDGFAEYFVEL